MSAGLLRKRVLGSETEAGGDHAQLATPVIKDQRYLGACGDIGEGAVAVQIPGGDSSSHSGVGRSQRDRSFPKSDRARGGTREDPAAGGE